MAFFDEDWKPPRQGQATPARSRPHGNLRALRLAIFGLFALLALQLFRMQIVDGAEYSRKATENHITEQTKLGARGLILDRNGEPLVENVPVYVATITPDFLPRKKDARYEIYLTLERLTGITALDIQTRVERQEVQGRGFVSITLARQLTQEQAIKLEEASTSMPGVSLVVRPGRAYPAGPEFSHILGYIGDQDAEDYKVLRSAGYQLNEPVGKAGIEARYERDLRGRPGVTAAEQNAEGRLLKELGSRPAETGKTVRLAIDAGLQRYVSQLLQDRLRSDDPKNADAKVAAAVVMEAKTGRVVAIASYPSYDNNIFSRPADQQEAEFDQLLHDPRTPLVNHALSPSAPGSTFKIVTAAAGLQNGTITPQTSRTINSRVLEIKGENGQIYPFYDWTTHGNINLQGAIARSSNIYFYMTSCGIPGEYRGLAKDDEGSATVLGYYAKQFGYGAMTGIDIGGDAPGIVPDPNWKRRVHADDNPEDREWYYADTCFMGIGQGDVSASPMQVTRMTAAVASGGKVYTPHVAAEILDPEGNVVRTIEPEWSTVDVDPKWLEVIRGGMLQSVGPDGAGAKAYQPGIDIAGKTGTAEFFLKNGEKAQHAWFTGFAPYNDPEYVVTVYFDIGVGGDKAAPVAGQIFRYIWDEVR